MIRIGAGAGFASDRIQDANELLKKGNLDYFVLECLGERTVATAQRRKREGKPGYGTYFKERMETFLSPAVANNTTIVTSDGAADPLKAGQLVAEIADDQGLSVDVTVITGDDCKDNLEKRGGEMNIDSNEILSANAYIGAQSLVNALEMKEEGDAHIVISGRIADPSLYLAPMIHEFGWDWNDWDRLGQGTAIGHLMECAGQVTGGFFMEPDRKHVDNPHLLGKPFVDVAPSGDGIIGKLDDAGGRIDTHTCREQLFYEVHDPEQYLTPDVTADFTGVDLEVVDKNRVRVTGGNGSERPQQLKVSVGLPGGYKTQCYRAYGAPNAVGRARLAGEIVRKRVEEVHNIDVRLRVDIVGVNALFGDADDDLIETPEPREVLLRVVAHSPLREDVETVYREVSAIAVNGPAAASTFYPERKDAAVSEIVSVESAFLPRDEVVTKCHQI